MKAVKILLVLAVVALAAACNPCRKAQTLILPPFAGQMWQLEAINGKAHPYAGGISYTITFGADGRVIGTADCNKFFGTYYYATRNGKIKMGRLGVTRMMCVNQESDNEYLELMQKVVKTKADRDQLTVTLSDGQVLTYRAK